MYDLSGVHNNPNEPKWKVNIIVFASALLKWVGLVARSVYSLGKHGGWLTWANDTAEHIVAIRPPHQRTTGPAVQPADIPQPNQQHSALPRNPWGTTLFSIPPRVGGWVELLPLCLNESDSRPGMFGVSKMAINGPANGTAAHTLAIYVDRYNQQYHPRCNQQTYQHPSRTKPSTSSP